MTHASLPLDDPRAPAAEPGTSTALLERTEVVPQLQEPGDHERFAHYGEV